MDYIFKGNFSYKNHLIPFQLQDGHVRLNVSNLSRNEICHIDNNGVEWFSTNSPFNAERASKHPMAKWRVANLKR